ncbi:GntR family transcriptional regulator [Belnapia sp. F-4-1]|uniref:GntR family transcriptional regulator n=1 Tax=Belnapia sp. F-4-1 TaxID=1545443 RepID=UPI0005B7BBA9|nr:GntR family transcriptional regulator [Belnapia sp. F-4-1]
MAIPDRNLVEVAETDPAPTLARQVMEQLRRDILKGLHPPGSRLRIEGLRERYGTGASPIREALSQLAAEGLVLRVDQRGFRVAPADTEILRDLIETRCLVEAAALRASIARGDAAWEERVLVSHHRLARTPRSAEPDRFIPNPDWEACHRAFHLALLGGCGAQALLAFCADLQDRALRFRNLSNQVAWPQRDVAAEHKAICEAAIGRRSEEACMLLDSHYRRTGHFLGAAAP